MALFKLFGLHPLGYHIVNQAVFAASLGTLYVTLERATYRQFALATTLLYGFLPHFSTDLFWFAASHATVALFTFCLSGYFELRASEDLKSRMIFWKLGACAFGAIALITYEVFLPYLLALPFLLLAHARARGRSWSEIRGFAFLGLLNLVAIAGVIRFKLSVTTRGNGSVGAWLLAAAWESGRQFLFGAWGLGLSRTLTDLARQPGQWLPTIGAISILILVSAYMWKFPDKAEFTVRRLVLVAFGSLALASVGHSYFLYPFGVHWGSYNRVLIASALPLSSAGASTILALYQVVTRNKHRWTLALMVATVRGIGGFTQSSLASTWREAADRQESIKTELRRVLPSIPDGGFVLLDGFCPWLGPATIFEVDWDVTGMLRLTYPNSRARGAVYRPWMKMEPLGIVEGTYQWSGYDRLFIFDDRSKRIHQIKNPEDGRAYQATRPNDSIETCLNTAGLGTGYPLP